MGRFAGTLNTLDYIGNCSICGEPKSMVVNLFGMTKVCANHTESNCPNKESVADGTWTKEKLDKRKKEILEMGKP